jgi:hypothetical protein
MSKQFRNKLNFMNYVMFYGGFILKKNYQLANQSKFFINKAQTFKDRNNFYSTILYININIKIRFL